MNVSAQDRFLYAPLLFGLGGLVVFFRDAILRVAEERVAKLAIAGTVLVWIVLIAIRTPDFRDDHTFWTSEVQQNPDHPYVLHSFARVAAREGDLETANEYFRRAAQPEA